MFEGIEAGLEVQKIKLGGGPVSSRGGCGRASRLLAPSAWFPTRDRVLPLMLRGVGFFVFNPQLLNDALDVAQVRFASTIERMKITTSLFHPVQRQIGESLASGEEPFQMTEDATVVFAQDHEMRGHDLLEEEHA